MITVGLDSACVSRALDNKKHARTCASSAAARCGSTTSHSLATALGSRSSASPLADLASPARTPLLARRCRAPSAPSAAPSWWPPDSAGEPRPSSSGRLTLADGRRHTQPCTAADMPAASVARSDLGAQPPKPPTVVFGGECCWEGGGGARRRGLMLARAGSSSSSSLQAPAGASCDAAAARRCGAREAAT